MIYVILTRLVHYRGAGIGPVVPDPLAEGVATVMAMLGD
jgi:hypothetical protein